MTEEMERTKAMIEMLIKQTINYLMTGNKKDDSWKKDGIK